MQCNVHDNYGAHVRPLGAQRKCTLCWQQFLQKQLLLDFDRMGSDEISGIFRETAQQIAIACKNERI